MGEFYLGKKKGDFYFILLGWFVEQEKTYLCRCFYCKAHINILLKVWFYCSVKRPLTTQFNSKVALLICHWKLQFYSLSFHLNSGLHGKKRLFSILGLHIFSGCLSNRLKMLFVHQDLNFSLLFPLLLVFILPFLQRGFLHSPDIAQSFCISMRISSCMELNCSWKTTLCICN